MIAKTEFGHHMQVTRIWERPRITKPYTDSQWSGSKVGHEIDAKLLAMDVRLWGGEPTFVAIDVGWRGMEHRRCWVRTKRLLAADLFRRLREKYAPHGLMHFGQGQVVSGEQLPRWSLNCLLAQGWRADLVDSPLLYANERLDYAPPAPRPFLSHARRSLELDPGSTSARLLKMSITNGASAACRQR